MSRARIMNAATGEWEEMVSASAYSGLREALEGILSNVSLDWYVQQFARSPAPGTSGVVARIHNEDTRERVAAAFERARAALAEHGPIRDMPKGGVR